MRLIIARSNYFSYSETFIEEQIKQLNPVDVLYEGWLPNRLKSGGSIYSFPLNILLVRGALRNLFPTLAKKIYIYFLKRYLVKNNIDTFLANYGPLCSNIYEACISINIPFSVIFLGFDASEKKTLETYKNEYKEFLPKAKSVIIVAESMRSNLENISGPLSNVHVIPCGVDTNFFTPGVKKEGINIISVGRFAEKKGPLKSIKAFELFIQKFPKASYKMIGDGPLFEEAKKYVEENNLSKHIQFLGALPQEKYVVLLKESNIFMQHSFLTPSGDSEGTPVAILEASACGLAICSTKHAGIPDAVINGETGLLVEENDIQGMAEALIKMASNPELIELFGKNGRNHIVNNYDVHTLSLKIKSILQ